MVLTLLATEFKAAPYPREQMAVILLPISTRPVVGSRGQTWRAEIRAHNTSDQTVPFHQGIYFCGVAFCTDGILPGQTLKLNMGGPPNNWPGQGQLAYVDREKAHSLAFESHVLVSSGSVERTVAELPVVGESELLQSGVLPYVPVTAGSRISLRVYDASPNSQNLARIRIYSSLAPSAAVLIDDVVPLSYDGPWSGDGYDFPEFPGYLQLDDLAMRYPDLSNQTAIRIHIDMLEPELPPSLWFFASVTSTDDQSVVLYTPDSAK